MPGLLRWLFCDRNRDRRFGWSGRRDANNLRLPFCRCPSRNVGSGDIANSISRRSEMNSCSVLFNPIGALAMTTQQASSTVSTAMRYPSSTFISIRSTEISRTPQSRLEPVIDTGSLNDYQACGIRPADVESAPVVSSSSNIPIRSAGLEHTGQ